MEDKEKRKACGLVLKNYLLFPYYHNHFFFLTFSECLYPSDPPLPMLGDKSQLAYLLFSY